jgi:hypothetical protein
MARVRALRHATIRLVRNICLLVLALMLAPATFAQDAHRGELGVRYWLSTGETLRSHSSQGVDPTLGNPTSVLLYENLDANVFELFGRGELGVAGWFVKGTLGLGQINRGSFDDEDFDADQVKFSDTTSSLTDGRIGYGTIDVGHQWVLRQGGLVLGVFGGFAQWTEHVHAYGATDHIGFIGGDIERGVKVISNKVIWRGLRVGFAGDAALGERTRLSTDFAFLPYAKVRNEDSHHLRTSPADLGPVPNIILEGDGWGVQWDAELRHEIMRRTELSVGYRYWYMESTDGERRVPNVNFPNVPLVELYSKRSGLTLSLRRTW